MSNSLNQCNFIGNLGKDPSTKYTPGGMAVTEISIAVGYKYKETERTEWVKVTAFGKLAEIIEEFLHKGDSVFISGRLQTDSWEKDGVKHYRTKVVAHNMQMLSKRSGNEQKPDVPDEVPIEDIPF